MKAVTFVAGLAGTVAAGHAHKHARHHARDAASSTWAEWDPASTTIITTSSSSSTWAEWDPASTTTTTTTTSASKWGEWDPASSSTTTTTSASTWGEWDPVSSSTTTSSSETAWTEWDPSTSAAATTTAWSAGAEASVCVQAVVYITGDPTWAPDEATTSTVTSTSLTTLTVSPVETTTASAAATSSVWSDWTSAPSGSSVYSSPAWSPASSSSVYSSPTWTPASSSSVYSSSAWSSSSSSTPSATPSLGSNSETWAMTYSPYTSSGGCKDAGTVYADIAAIAGKGFSTVRVYSTDCSTLANVGGAARSNNLKLILGVFISSTGISGAEGQVTDIVSWAQWDIVELVVIGNEAVFNGYCSASALAGFISSVKGTLSGAGYAGPVSTTEPIDTWLSSGSTFCGVVDVVAANLYAFFNAQTTADQAGTFIQAEIAELEGICSGKDVYVMETGWPHAGNCNGAACPSPSNQATAINSIKSVVGAKVVFFSFEDDAWKSPGQFDVEQYWGCADVFSGA